MKGDAARGVLLPLRLWGVDEAVERHLELLVRGSLVFIRYAWPGVAALAVVGAVARREPVLGVSLVATTWIWLGLCFLSLVYAVVARAGQSWFWPRTLSMAVNGLAFVSLIWYGPDTLM